MNQKDSWPTIVNRNDRSMVQEPTKTRFSYSLLACS